MGDMKWTHKHPTTPGWYWIEDRTQPSTYRPNEPDTAFMQLSPHEDSPTGWAWADPYDNWDYVEAAHMIENPLVRFCHLPYPKETP